MNNREIKFRVWDKSWERMMSIQEAYTEWEGADRDSKTFGFFVNELFSNNLDRYVVMQYTGLKDKNGDEIYGADILEWKEKNYGWHSGDKEVIKKRKVVKYQTHYGAGWNFGMSHKDEAKRFSFPLPADAEIIGNKFENPNLLSND